MGFLDLRQITILPGVRHITSLPGERQITNLTGMRHLTILPLLIEVECGNA